MRKQWLVSALMLTLSAAVAGAQPKIEKGPIKATSAADPKVMFDSYCAVCHGIDGKGTGPAASAFKKAPADLTMISARNGGTFPGIKVKRYIEGADELPAHGSRDMPVWGRLFRGLDPDTAVIREAALTEYLKKLQR